MRILAPALAVLLLLSGCAGRAADPPAPTASGTSAAAEATDLVGGFWRVEADGEDADTWLTMGTHDITVFRPEGVVDGEWTARGAALLASTSGWSMSLGAHHDVPWLVDAASVEADGDGFALLDEQGDRVAVLSRDGRPPASDQYVTDPATREPEALATIGSATPGPEVAPIDPAAVLGTWHLRTAREASITFADGRWSERTSCETHTGANGGGGAYRVLPDGSLLVTTGPSTAIGCVATQSIPPDGWRALAGFGAARSISVGDGTLTVYDAAGSALGTLVR